MQYVFALTFLSLLASTFCSPTLKQVSFERDCWKKEFFHRCDLLGSASKRELIVPIFPAIIPELSLKRAKYSIHNFSSSDLSWSRLNTFWIDSFSLGSRSILCQVSNNRKQRTGCYSIEYYAFVVPTWSGSLVSFHFQLSITFDFFSREIHIYDPKMLIKIYNSSYR